MYKVINALLIVIAIASAFVWGWCAGGRHSKAAVSKTETTADTLWREIHDTCFVERAVAVVRTDTVRLAYVPENGNSWTRQDGYGYGNGISGTHADTLYVHDSVFVEVPIEERTFEGDNYSIVAEGYRVRLREVTVISPTVYVTETRYKSKRWNFNVGAQIGYGYTLHGASPYAGVGVGFSYAFGK